MRTPAGVPKIARWTIDEPFCELSYDGADYRIRVRARITDEAYQSHTPAREFVPLVVKAGTRAKVEIQPYAPDPTLARSKGLRHDRVGDGEAYYYTADRIILLWKCRLGDPYKVADPTRDTNLRALWLGFQRFLLGRFPATTQILTPAWNRPYDAGLWRQFIHALGYTRPSPAGIPNEAYIRDVAPMA